MTANRRSPGRTSRNSPRRLAARSLPRFDRPVTFPPAPPFFSHRSGGMGVNDLASGRSSANAPGRRVVDGDGKAHLTASGDVLSFQQSGASLLPHALAALGTKGLGAASRLMVAWLTP